MAARGIPKIALLASSWRLLLNETDRNQLLGLIRPATVK